MPLIVRQVRGWKSPRAGRDSGADGLDPGRMLTSAEKRGWVGEYEAWSLLNLRADKTQISATARVEVLLGRLNETAEYPGETGLGWLCHFLRAERELVSGWWDPRRCSDRRWNTGKSGPTP